MSFFQPMPPPPERTGPYGPSWAPPAWDRPSEGVSPAVMPVNELLVRGEDAALVLRSVEVYRNGLVLDIKVMRNPRGNLEDLHHHVFTRPDLWPRIGIQFADGRRAGDAARPLFGMTDAPRDEVGLPTEPVLVFRGGGGGGTEFSLDHWLYPLPPDGPMKIYATWSTVGAGESMIELDGAAIRRASEDAVVIWE